MVSARVCYVHPHSSAETISTRSLRFIVHANQGHVQCTLRECYKQAEPETVGFPSGVIVCLGRVHLGCLLKVLSNRGLAEPAVAQQLPSASNDCKWK